MNDSCQFLFFFFCVFIKLIVIRYLTSWAVCILSDNNFLISCTTDKKKKERHQIKCRSDKNEIEIEMCWKLKECQTETRYNDVSFSFFFSLKTQHFCFFILFSVVVDLLAKAKWTFLSKIEKSDHDNCYRYVITANSHVKRSIWSSSLDCAKRHSNWKKKNKNKKSKKKNLSIE